MNEKIRVLLADDHMFLRVGLSTLIDNKSDMTVVGEAENGREAVELTRKLRPDVVIMDLMMPEMSGAEATKVIHSEMPEVKIIVLTSSRVEFNNSIVTAGINQTKHQINLEVIVDIDILVPWGTESTQVITEVLIADTIVVGRVPDTYLSMESGLTEEN